MIAIRRNRTIAHARYLPTQTEIERACEEIQATWSRTVRDLRSAERQAARWTVPIVTLTDVLQAVPDEQADGRP